MPSAGRRLYGTAVVVFSMLRQRGASDLPLDRLRQVRDKRVRYMVRYAARAVPYYQDVFRDLQMDPADFCTAEDLSRLPLIDKGTVRSQPERFRSTSGAGRTAVRFVTSGTTGEPLTIYHDRYSLLAKVAFDQRKRAVSKEILGTIDGLRTLLIGYDGCTADRWHSFLDENCYRRVRGNQKRLFGTESLDGVLETIHHYRPHIISGTGSYLAFLFRAAAARRVDLHRPRLVEFYGQSISDDTRWLIMRHFGAALHSFYGAVETFDIGFTCAESSHWQGSGLGFHLNVDLVHLRIVDDEGHNVPTGVQGEVVVSNLVNRGTVLLNYRLGDRAALLPEPCPCGRELPLLVDLEGRSEDNLCLPNGEVVFGRLIWRLFKQRDEVIRYQLIQHALDHFELRLVTPDPETFERIKADVVAELQGLLGQSAHIVPLYCQELGKDARKFKPVVSNVREREVW